ncbi:MAG: hypothetical protein M3R02_09015 [Chloroflexota bacterium]|nr:hypothetical protein [Chloroflexota bacterium]
MSERELIDGLIATYRELNNRVRPLPEERLGMRSGQGGSVRDVITRLRDSELRFSQALKERITGVAMPEIFGEDEAPVLGTEHANDPTRVILSQFGTARESTLAMLRTLPAEEWNQSLEGGRTINERIRQLVANDRQHLERINGLLGAP